MRSNAAENRSRILDAAVAVFGEHGAAGSTEDVAHRAGVGIATVFRHFPTKTELVDAATAHRLDALAGEVSRLAGRGDPGAAVRPLVRALVLGTSSRLAQSAPTGAALPEATRAEAELQAAVDAVLRPARRAGAVRRGVTATDVVLLAGALGATGAGRDGSKQAVDRAIRIVLDGLRA